MWVAANVAANSRKAANRILTLRLSISSLHARNLSGPKATATLHQMLSGHTFLAFRVIPVDRAKPKKTCAIMAASFTSFRQLVNPFSIEVDLPTMIRHLPFVCVLAVAPYCADPAASTAARPRLATARRLKPAAAHHAPSARCPGCARVTVHGICPKGRRRRLINLTHAQSFDERTLRVWSHRST